MHPLVFLRRLRQCADQTPLTSSARIDCLHHPSNIKPAKRCHCLPSPAALHANKRCMTMKATYVYTKYYPYVCPHNRCFSVHISVSSQPVPRRRCSLPVGVHGNQACIAGHVSSLSTTGWSARVRLHAGHVSPSVTSSGAAVPPVMHHFGTLSGVFRGWKHRSGVDRAGARCPSISSRLHPPEAWWCACRKCTTTVETSGVAV